MQVAAETDKPETVADRDDRRTVYRVQGLGLIGFRVQDNLVRLQGFGGDLKATATVQGSGFIKQSLWKIRARCMQGSQMVWGFRIWGLGVLEFVNRTPFTQPLTNPTILF